VGAVIGASSSPGLLVLSGKRPGPVSSTKRRIRPWLAHEAFYNQTQTLGTMAEA
jgi:hypothetical protein